MLSLAQKRKDLVDIYLDDYNEFFYKLYIQ